MWSQTLSFVVSIGNNIQEEMYWEAIMSLMQQFWHTVM